MATFPSAALQIQQPPSVVDQTAKLMSLKSMLQQQQLQQAQLTGEQQRQGIAAQLAPLQIQEAQTQAQMGQINLQNQQRLQRALSAGQIDFGQPGALNGFIQAGGPAAIPLVAQLTDIASKQASTSNTLLGEHIKKLDQYRGQLMGVISGDQAAKAASWKRIVDGAVASGDLQQGQVPDVYPGDQQAMALANTLALGSALATEQAQQTRANAAQSEANTAATRLNTEAPGIVAAAQINQQKASAGLQGTAAAQAAGQAQGAVQGATAAAGGNTGMQDSIDQAAQIYATTGQLPRFYGSSGAAMQMAVIKRAAELFPNQNFAINAANYTANKASLDQLTKQYNAVNAFESTAGKNLDLFIQKAQKVADSGSPWLNRPVRATMTGAAGSPDITAYNAARQTALNEIAKVLNNPTSSAALTDTARKEVETILSPNATLGQALAAAQVLRQDMGNRMGAYEQQIQ